MTSLHDPTVHGVLAELHGTARHHDEITMPTIMEEAARRNARSDGDIADLLADAYMPIDPVNGSILHVLAALRPTPQIVEFGTSHGLSTIYLAAAVSDADPPVVTCELEPAKADAARANLTAAGLAHRVDIRIGDAFETLADGPEPIGLVFLDGWKGAYLPMLRMLEPRLVQNSVIVADDVTLLPELCADYLDYVRSPASPYRSATLPFDDGLELSVYTP